MSSTADEVLNCCERILRSEANLRRYANKKFSMEGVGRLLQVAKQILPNAPVHKRPGCLSFEVADQNTKEPVYQRAIYLTKTTASVSIREEPASSVKWLDMELPVMAVPGKARCRSIDLIGQLEPGRPFVWELKWAKSPCTPHSLDYALFEALVYLGIIKKTCRALNDHGVFHPGQRQFDWQAVASSDRVAVVANEFFYRRAIADDSIPLLRESVRNGCGVEVLFYSLPNYSIGRRPDRAKVPCFVGVDLVEMQRVFL